MTKKEFMQELSRRTGLTQVLLSRVFEETLDIITEEVSNGGRIVLNNFGIFSCKHLKKRRLVSPQGEVVIKSAGITPVFKFTKVFKERF